MIEYIHQHYEAIVRKDLAGILDKYDSSEKTYVILEGPRLTTIPETFATLRDRVAAMTGKGSPSGLD